MINKKKLLQLDKQMHSLGVKENDLIEKFITASGKGGQKVNKTSVAVYLKHVPTSLEVKCQRERSREANRFWARRLLLEKITCALTGVNPQEKKNLRIRKQKDRRKRRQKKVDMISK